MVPKRLLLNHLPFPFPLCPDPPLDPCGPSAGRVVVSGDRRFYGAQELRVPTDVVLCLVEEARINEAKAAAADEDDTTPKYLVTVYARRAGVCGPAVPFRRVPLTPSPAGRGTITWRLGGLGPLRQHLDLAPGSPVRLVREVGQDGRVRLVVEPREEGEGGGRQGKGKANGKRPVRKEAQDSDSGSSSGSGADGDSQPAGGSDDEESSGEGTSSEDPDWVPGEGGGQGAGGTGRAQQQETQPQQRQQQQQQQASHPLPPPSQRMHREVGCGRDGAGPSGAVGSEAGGAGDVELDRAEVGPRGGREERLGKRRRLEIITEQPEAPPAAGQNCKRLRNWPDGGWLLLRCVQVGWTWAFQEMIEPTATSIAGGWSCSCC